jgi:hypothetical protein
LCRRDRGPKNDRGICLKGPRRTTKTFNQRSPCPKRGSNRRPPEYNSEPSPITKIITHRISCGRDYHSSSTAPRPFFRPWPTRYRDCKTTVFLRGVRGSLVGIATGWTVLGSNPGGGLDFPYPSRPAPGPTQPPIRYIIIQVRQQTQQYLEISMLVTNITISRYYCLLTDLYDNILIQHNGMNHIKHLYNGYWVFPEVQRPERGVDHPTHLAPKLKIE